MSQKDCDISDVPQVVDFQMVVLFHHDVDYSCILGLVITSRAGVGQPPCKCLVTIPLTIIKIIIIMIVIIITGTLVICKYIVIERQVYGDQPSEAQPRA